MQECHNVSLVLTLLSLPDIIHDHTSILSGVNVSCNAESNVLRRADNQPQSMWQPAYNRLFAPAVSIPPFLTME
jgi:hypothetical protein